MILFDLFMIHHLLNMQVNSMLDNYLYYMVISSVIDIIVYFVNIFLFFIVISL